MAERMKLTETEQNRAFNLFYKERKGLGEITAILRCAIADLPSYIVADAIRGRQNDAHPPAPAAPTDYLAPPDCIYEQCQDSRCHPAGRCLCQEAE